jgi:hypothetical protein
MSSAQQLPGLKMSDLLVLPEPLRKESVRRNGRGRFYP